MIRPKCSCTSRKEYFGKGSFRKNISIWRCVSVPMLRMTSLTILPCFWSPHISYQDVGSNGLVCTTLEARAAFLRSCVSYHVAPGLCLFEDRWWVVEVDGLLAPCEGHGGTMLKFIKTKTGECTYNRTYHLDCFKTSLVAFVLYYMQKSQYTEKQSQANLSFDLRGLRVK